MDFSVSALGPVYIKIYTGSEQGITLPSNALDVGDIKSPDDWTDANAESA